MYKFKVDQSVRYEVEELIKIFLKQGEYEISETHEIMVPRKTFLKEHLSENHNILSEDEYKKYKNKCKREVFRFLSEKTGLVHPWGILTGVRPVKLARELYEKIGNRNKVSDYLINYYLLSEDKAQLLIDTYELQRDILKGTSEEDAISIYIGIPFCPTRCLYCSFTSNKGSENEIWEYLNVLKQEIHYAGKRIKELGLKIESIYVGGGTPTTLNPGQLDELLSYIDLNFNMDTVKEFTVEAGRPDTITVDKLKVIRNHGVDRISINPQTMKDETLRLIGREHLVNHITEAYAKAISMNIKAINMDLIAGLPGESRGDFVNSLQKILELNPENITIHTLAVKKASRLIEEDKDFHYKQAEIVQMMLKDADYMLKNKGYKPYYLYRQKNMAGGFENIGWCRDDNLCIYNVRIMDENRNILALGAGGVSKMYYPKENRIERIPNVSNYKVYIERINQMIARKEEKFFKEVEKTC